jgi:hypothetical protein
VDQIIRMCSIRDKLWYIKQEARFLVLVNYEIAQIFRKYKIVAHATLFHIFCFYVPVELDTDRDINMLRLRLLVAYRTKLFDEHSQD